MIVVDSNILAYLYLPCEFSAAVEALLEQDPEWAAAVLWRSEFRNILAGYLRRETLTLEQASTLQAEAEAFLSGLEFEGDSRSVLAFVSKSDCSAYACEFIALAERLDTKLITMDKKLLRAFPKRAVALPVV